MGKGKGRRAVRATKQQLKLKGRQIKSDEQEQDEHTHILYMGEERKSGKKGCCV